MCGMDIESVKEWAEMKPRRFVPKVEVLEKYGVKPKEYMFLREVTVGTINYSGQASGAILGIKQMIPAGMKVLFSLEEKKRRDEYPADWILLQEPIEDIHSLIYYAAGLVSSGDSMAREAALLGVPFVRFNDFVGRIGYLRELEDVYELGYGIHASVLPADSPIRRNDGSLQPSGVEELYKRVEQLVTMPSAERRELFQQRRQQMLNDKIDCAKFLTWFIENYPQSAEQTRNANSSFWQRFK